MKIGYIQFAPCLGAVQNTFKKLDELIAKCEGADLLVLPELCNSGYNLKTKEMAWEVSEEIEKSIFVEYLHNKCVTNKCYIVSGFAERCNGRIYNTSILMGPEGFIGKYRKLHLFMKEKDILVVFQFS